MVEKSYRRNGEGQDRMPRSRLGGRFGQALPNPLRAYALRPKLKMVHMYYVQLQRLSYRPISQDIQCAL
jgi:hypothetical protein